MGDLAFSLHVAHYLELRERGEKVPPAVDAHYPFTHVGERLRQADVLLGNLECVVSPKGVVSTDHNPFRAPLFTPRILKENRVDLVSLANNHSADFGESAFVDMTDRLRAEGVPFLGGNSFRHGPESPHIATVNGLRIGYLGFYLRSLEGAVSDAMRARPSVDILVVFNHWGRDDTKEVLPLQRRLGRALIDAGVDLVVGTHTHVLQPEEWYKGKLIFYGLGNFIFSGQNFDDAHRTGGYLEATVTAKGLVRRRFYRTQLDNAGAPHWLDNEPVEPEKTAESEPPNQLF